MWIAVGAWIWAIRCSFVTHFCEPNVRTRSQYSRVFLVPLPLSGRCERLSWGPGSGVPWSALPGHHALASVTLLVTGPHMHLSWELWGLQDQCREAIAPSTGRGLPLLGLWMCLSLRDPGLEEASSWPSPVPSGPQNRLEAATHP